MASLIQRGFGGMSPSSRETGQDPGVASYCQNLDLRFGDFRPLRAAANVATVTAGATLYRFETAGGFISNAGQVNYVRGPIPTDTTERTYYTGDGAPKVTDTTGQVRQLGVPAPTSAPAVVVNSTAQYSTDDSAKDQAKKLAEIVVAIRANYTWPWIGLTDAELAARFIPQNDIAKWSYSLKFAGTYASGVFTPTNPAHANLMDDRLYFHVGPTPTDPTIWGFVDLDVRAQYIEIGAGIDAALAAITDPTDNTGAKKLLTSDQVQTIKGTLLDALKPADQARDDAIVRLRELKDQFLALADSGSDASGASAGAVSTFYQKASVTAAINDAVSAAVSSIFDAMFTYNNA